MKEENIIEYIASCLVQRIADMKKQDAIDGRHNSTLHDYILWSLEEVQENDGIVFTKVNEN